MNMKRMLLGLCLLISLLLCGCAIFPQEQVEKTQPDTNNHAENTENKPKESIVEETLTEIKETESNLKSPLLKNITPLDIDEFEIEWSNIEGADGYILSCKEDNGEYHEIADISADTLTYHHQKLTNGTTYSYQVQAYAGSGESKMVSEESNSLEQKCNNNLIDFYQPYRSEKYMEYRGSNTFIMSGEHRNNSFTLTTDGLSKDLYIDYNLEGKYKAIQFTYGFVDGAKASKDDKCKVVLKVLADDEIDEVYDVTSAEIAKTVKIDITYVNKLEFYVERQNTWWGEFGFADVQLFK